MEENRTQEQINEINRKLDIIIGEIELQKKSRMEMEDLKDDLMRVGKDLYITTVDELEEVSEHLQTGDMLHLLKKLLRNVNNISGMFDQLESINNLFKDVAPISREIIIDFMQKLDEFDRKGYFGFIREFMKVMDNVVDSFTVEDVKELGDNVVTILEIVKKLTDPEMLKSINNGLEIYKNIEMKENENVSYFALLKKMNTPEVRRGMAFGINLLQSFVEENQNKST